MAKRKATLIDAVTLRQRELCRAGMRQTIRGIRTAKPNGSPNGRDV